MIRSGFNWVRRQFEPAEGWLPFFLLIGIVAALISAVADVGWVPEDNVVFVAALLGLLLGALLAKRPIGSLAAWALILSYGLLANVIWLGRLWPSLAHIVDGWGATSLFIRQNWALFVDRFGGWLLAVSSGNRTVETIVFAFGLGLLAYLLAAYASWTTFRQHRPLNGLMAMSFALAINGFYGDAAVWPVALFVGLSVLLVALIQFADLEQLWATKGVDYSPEIRFDMLTTTGAVAIALLFVTFAVPTVNLRAIYRAVFDRPAVHQVEDTLERIFAGVQQPQQGVAGQGPGAGTPGALPRGFLLGNPPELYETVVMTTSVSGEAPPGIHWRGQSYDVYTGRGWLLSSERWETIPAGQAIPSPSVGSQSTVSQTVSWQLGERPLRYTLGLPHSFDQEVVAYWRGQDDLSRVLGDGTVYSAVSSASLATPADLHAAPPARVPPVIAARYTELVDSIPQRVLDLAQEISDGVADPGQVPSPYQQAKALERFLRQYPYSLEVELPPAGADPVDFFLFDLQAGYCDYYASSMVVMARSLGLPARLATGFLAQPADDDGFQTIYQINAHSWAEIYFAGYGWIEFEPTAAFPTRDVLPPSEFPEETDIVLPFEESPPLPLPDPQPQQSFPLWVLGFLIFPVAAGWWLWRRRKQRTTELDGVLWAYDRLLGSSRHLGQPATPNQTPAEFKVALFGRLRFLGRQRLTGWLDLSGLYRDIDQLTASYVARQYGARKPSPEAAKSSWRRIRGRLWLLGIINRTIGRKFGPDR